MRRAVLLVLFAGGCLVTVLALSAGPRPCEVQSRAADATPAPPRLVTAKSAPVGHYLKTSQDAVGIVVGYGPAPADALDQTGTVQLLVLDPGRGGNARGETATLGGQELAIDLGPVPLPG